MFNHVEITPKMLAWAEARLRKYIPDWTNVTDFRALGKHSAYKNAYFGVLGEAVFWCVNQHATYMGNDFGSYDFKMDGYSYEVKTSWCSVTPQPHYEAMLNKRKLKMELPDRFAFARINKNLKEGWLLGWIEPEHLFRVATLRLAGESRRLLPAEYLMTYSDDCYEIKYSEMHSFN